MRLVEAKNNLEESHSDSQESKWLKLCQEKIMNMEENPKYLLLTQWLPIDR